MASTTTETSQLEILPISESDWTPVDRFQFDGIDMEVRINEIVVDPVYQMRADGTNPDVVQRYAEIMKQNDPDGWLAFPLIKLFKNHDADSRKVLISGFHRLEAMKLNGYDEIKATVSGGAHLDGLIVASGENADRSQPRTNADIQNIVEMFLTNPELCQWSNAQIARWAQVDAQTVANHERRLLSTPNFGIDNRPETRKFIDKHGNVSERKAPSPSPPASDEKQRETDYKAFVKHRDAAHHAWKAYCEQHEMPFDWESFCLFAEEHLDGEGCLSLPSPNTSTLDEIREKSLTCQKLKSAISARANWVFSHRIEIMSKQAKAEPIPAAEEGPDLQGLKEAVYDSLDEGSLTYAPELAHVYSVPLDQVESIIEKAKADFEMEAAEKHKESLMNDYDDLTAEGWELWSKHLQQSISWDGLFAAAQLHWLPLEDSCDYSPADESEKALKLQIGIWRSFKADLEYAISVINNEPAGRGQIWLLKLLVIKPEPTPPDLDGLRNNLKRMVGSDTKPNPSILSQAYHVPEDVVISEIKNCDFTEPTWIQIIVHGQHHTGEIDRHVFRVDTPMADEYIVLIGNAAMEAAKEAYTRISAERTEEEA